MLSEIETFFPLLTCNSESDLEAEQSQATLQGLVKELLQSNQQISSRLQNIEDSLETGSILTNCFRNGTLDESAEDSDPEDLYRAEPARNIRRNLSEDSSQPGFHDDLGTSRVYRRTERYESDVSFTSSAVRTHAWSIFSGLSLSEVSVISAIALPLFLEEISNRQWYTSGRLDNASSKPSRQVMNESFQSASTSVYATTIEPVAQMVEPRGLGGVSSLLNPPTSSGGSPASSSALASTSRSIDSQRVINQQGLVFRDSSLTSLDASPLLESRESSAPSRGMQGQNARLPQLPRNPVCHYARFPIFGMQEQCVQIRQLPLYLVKPFLLPRSSKTICHYINLLYWVMVAWGRQNWLSR
jgi:hypothetical protein